MKEEMYPGASGPAAPVDMLDTDTELDSDAEFDLEETGETEFDPDNSEDESVTARLPAVPGRPPDDLILIEPGLSMSAEKIKPPPSRPPKPLRLKLDKYLVYQQLPTFAELIQQTVRFGPMLRLRYDETRITPELQALLTTHTDVLRVVGLVTEEDPDTLTVAPIVARLIGDATRWDLRIVLDSDATALASLLPEVDLDTAIDEWDLPQFLVFDEDWELVAQWGPRPAAAEAPLEAWLAAHPEYETFGEEDAPLTQTQYAAWWEELVLTMRVWYNSGLTKACLDEWRDLIMNLFQPGEEIDGDSQNT